MKRNETRLTKLRYDLLHPGRCAIPTPSLTAASLRPELERCGYRRSLLQADFRFGALDNTATIPLAAFAHEPLDAASACIAVILAEEDPADLVPRFRELGAPVLFAVHRQKLQWWSQRTEQPRHLATLEPTEIRGFFEKRGAELTPERIYRAKTRGRFESEYQLSFVDVGLMSLVEDELGRSMSDLVERAVTEVRRHFRSPQASEQGDHWLFRSVFWLLAAKILRDKQVPGFVDLDLVNVNAAFTRVADHYGATHREFGLQSQASRRALDAAAVLLSRFAPLAHVTTEALASVYETTLVSKETRSELGTHSTPSFLARYVVWRLAPWIAEMAPASRSVFEPTCGQGSFLIAAMRLLRDLLPEDVAVDERRTYLRRQLHGIDIDPFAIELARLSLTLADIPNPDGWDLRCSNVFSDRLLPKAIKETTIFLANPPFEAFKAEEREVLASQGSQVQPGSKAAELLRMTLPHLPAGAVFGVILPRGLLHGQGGKDVRSLLLEGSELAEITLLPDKVFTFSGAEAAIILGRRIQQGVKPAVPVRHSWVRGSDIERFRSSYAVSLERKLTQARFGEQPGCSFFVPELEEVWEECLMLPKLESIAEVGKGLEYESKLPAQSKTISSRPFSGAKRGFCRFDPKLMLHEQPEEVWMSLKAEVIRRPGAGSQTEVPQVLVNHARGSRGPWRLRALLDFEGHAVTSNFLTVRPRQAQTSLLYLWALLSSPLANAYCFTQSTTRHVLKRTLRSLPVPKASSRESDRVVAAVDTYLEAATARRRAFLAPDPNPALLRDLLLAVEAEILRLYDLPPRLERQILDLFAGHHRPGVPFAFDRYFPPGFEPYFPLHIYLSSAYRRATAGDLRRLENQPPEVVVRALEAAVVAFEG